MSSDHSTSTPNQAAVAPTVCAQGACVVFYGCCGCILSLLVNDVGLQQGQLPPPLILASIHKDDTAIPAGPQPQPQDTTQVSTWCCTGAMQLQMVL
jgi:hypothetical protein